MAEVRQDRAYGQKALLGKMRRRGAANTEDDPQTPAKGRYCHPSPVHPQRGTPQCGSGDALNASFEAGDGLLASGKATFDNTILRGAGEKVDPALALVEPNLV